MEIALSLLLDKRNMCAEAKGLLGHFGEVISGSWACGALAH